MHILLALAGLATAAYFIVIRARTGAEVATELIDMAADVRAAARRFGFRRRTNQHPVDGVDDPNLAIGALATAFLELDDLPTADQRTALDLSLRKHLDVDGGTAQEIAVLSRWLVESCTGPAAAFPRLAKRLRTVDGGASFPALMQVLGDVTAASQNAKPSHRQSDALAELSRIFRLK